MKKLKFLHRLTALEKPKHEVNKVHYIVYRESLPFLNGEITLDENSFEYLKAKVDASITNEMKVAGKPEIADHKIILDPDKSCRTTRILKAELIMYVTGRINCIQWTTSFSLI